MSANTFISTKNVSLITIICLWVGIAAQIILILANVIERVFVPIDVDSNNVSSSEFALGSISLATFAINIISYICTIIFFLIWLNRSYKNLSLFNIDGLSTTSGWAVGYWFIPILNLFKPLQVVNEIWHGSNPENAEKGYGFSDTSTPTLHGFWWAAWLIGNFLGRISNQLVRKNTNPEILTIAEYLGDVTSLFSIVAAYLLITIVKDTTERQEISEKKLAILTPPSPPTFN